MSHNVSFDSMVRVTDLVIKTNLCTLQYLSHLCIFEKVSRGLMNLE
jgi:hypothetical protein